MATQTMTKLVDDLDGGTAERTVTFGWDGHTYEIDLSKKNIAALDNALKPYIAAGRRSRAATGRGRASGRRGGAGKRTGMPDIREWARANGHEISDRGRIPVAVVTAYEAR
jgi:Lsr2